MTVPVTNIQSRLSLAYINAVVAQAGFGFWTPPDDFGLDGMLSRILVTNGKCTALPGGVYLQIKSTINYQIQDSQVYYEMDVEAYNKLLLPTYYDSGPTLFVLFCMPRDRATWVVRSEQQLALQHCCYWYVFPRKTPLSTNRRSITVRIPCAQVFDTAAVATIYDDYRPAVYFRENA